MFYISKSKYLQIVAMLIKAEGLYGESQGWGLISQLKVWNVFMVCNGMGWKANYKSFEKIILLHVYCVA